MTSLFESGFRVMPWGPALGQAPPPGGPGFIEDILTKAPGVASDIFKEKQAEEERKRAEAEAERARSEAERARTEQRGESRAMVLGIPRDYLIIGGIGVAVLAVIVAVAK